MTATKTYAPSWLTSDYGETILLASDVESAQAEASSYNSLDTVRVEPDGWMMDVGWDRENYELKRDFIAESGYTNWWESVGGDHDSCAETKKLRRAWKVIFLDNAR